LSEKLVQSLKTIIMKTKKKQKIAENHKYKQKKILRLSIAH